MTAAKAASEAVFVALMRGINLGGKNKLPMRELSALFATAGCSAVKTYIQSGNVVFRAPARLVTSLAATIQAAVAREHGLKVPVVLRSAAELERVTRDNPFLTASADPEGLHVMFLAQAPGTEAVASLDPQRSPGDEYRVIGGEIYLRCPNGLADSKLTNDYFDRRLATVSTGRNWRTVVKLIEMTREV